jgi:hypothetical protein
LLPKVYVFGLLAVWMLMALTDPFGLRGEELSWLGAAFAYVFVALPGWTGVVAGLAGLARAYFLAVEGQPAPAGCLRAA